MQSTSATISSTDTLPRRTPGASGHQPGDNGPVIPKIPGPRQPSGLAPRPTLPQQRLTAEMSPLLREIDWNGHIPTVSMTRQRVQAQLAAVEQDEPTERAYDRIVLGQPHAWGAF